LTGSATVTCGAGGAQRRPTGGEFAASAALGNQRKRERHAAPASLSADCRSRASTVRRFWRAANQISSERLTQAPDRGGERQPDLRMAVHQQDLEPTLTRTATNSALTGVSVSPRERNVTVALRISTNGSSPIA
jgi:hypothetical protein